METDPKPKHIENIPDKPNNILTIWKRLWPLIISVGLFVLMGIAWNKPVVYKDNGCPIPNENVDYIGLAASGMIAALIISQLLPSPRARRSLAAWFRYIIRTALVVIGASVAIIVNVTLLSNPTPRERIFGVIGFIGIAIVILVGHEHKRPTRYQAFIWLTSLLLLIFILYLGSTLFWQRMCFISDSGPLLPFARVFSPKLTLA